MSIVGPVDARQRALVTGQARCCRACGEKQLLLVTRNALDRERNSGIRHVKDRLDALVFEPAPCDRRTHVRLVLVVAGDDLDGSPEHFAPKILNGHLRRNHRALTAVVGVERGHVGQNTELDRRILRNSRRRK